MILELHIGEENHNPNIIANLRIGISYLDFVAKGQKTYYEVVCLTQDAGA